MCKVGDVVGPPYSITDICPAVGPVTGQTACTVKGMGFLRSGKQATVRFACIKGFIETPGDVISDSEIQFETVNFEKYGPIAIEGSSGSPTVSFST